MSGAPRLGDGAGVWALALGQTLGYACLFYIFAALILSLEADLGWSKRSFAMGPMLAIGISALAAPVAGRLVDRGYGRVLLAGGAGLGSLSLLALSQTATLTGYFAAWGGVGLAQAACLYEVAFAYLIRRFGIDARSHIIRVTLVAGLASTLAFPSGAALAAVFGWRGAVLVAAAVMLLAVLPLHLLACHLLRARSGTAPAGATARPRLSELLRKPAFLGLAALFSLIALNHWMLISFLVPLLVAQGVTAPLAVLAASLVGPAQTLGRLFLMRQEARLGTEAATRWTLWGLVLGSVLLAGAGLSPVFVFGFAALQGAAIGVMTILRPMLVAQALGSQGFGEINGLLSIPSLGASALAPVLAAMLFQAAGPAGMIAACLAFAAGALVLARVLARD